MVQIMLKVVVVHMAQWSVKPQAQTGSVFRHRSQNDKDTLRNYFYLGLLGLFSHASEEWTCFFTLLGMVLILI